MELVGRQPLGAGHAVAQAGEAETGRLGRIEGDEQAEHDRQANAMTPIGLGTSDAAG